MQRCAGVSCTATPDSLRASGAHAVLVLAVFSARSQESALDAMALDSVHYLPLSVFVLLPSTFIVT